MTTRKKAEFWAVADHLRSQRGWVPANAGYEFWSVLQTPRFRWNVCMKIHVLPAGEGPLAPRQFKASISLWPVDGRPLEEKRLGRAGWFESIQNAAANAGYKGKWTASPFGQWGDFWKDLATVADVRREAGYLAKLRLGSLGPPKPPTPKRVRRTKR